MAGRYDYDKVLVAHLNEVRAEVHALPREEAVAFGLVCLERMLPVYARAAEGQAWNGTGLLRAALDEAWKHLLEATPLAEGLGSRCEQASPPDEAEVDGLRRALAHTIANAFADFMDAIEEGDFQYASFAADRAIDVPDILADEPEFEGAVARALFQAEMARQKADLAQLKSAGLSRAAELRDMARRAELSPPIRFADTP
jgi:hypothetical protein